MTDSRETSTEILGRINADIEHFGGTLPERAAIAWRGYLAAMFERDLISIAEHDGLTAHLPPVPDDPAVAILLGRDAPSAASDADRQSSPSIGRTAASAASRQPLQVHQLRLQFAVSRDEEHVELAATLGEKRFDLGSRGHNYLLLTLARRRLEDAAAGLPDTSCGWVYQDDLADELDVTPIQMNVDIFRIRKQVAALGLMDAPNIVERRPRAKQLRIGIGALDIRSL